MRKLLILAVALGLLGALFASRARRTPAFVSGVLEADSIRIGSRVGGRLAEVLAQEGLRVARGSVIARFEPFDLAERRAQAEAELLLAREELARLEHGFRPEEIAQAEARRDQLAAQLARLEKGPREQEVSVGRARVELARAALELAQLEHARLSNLRASDTVSEGLLDRATSTLKTSTAELEVRELELALLEEGSRVEDVAQARAQLAEAEAALALARNGYRSEEIAQARAAVAASEASLAALDRRIAELEVRAPVDGFVESLEVRAGDLVAPDAPLGSMLDPARMWVRAYVPESSLSLQVDDVLELAVSAFPGERFRARVGFIAREAEFTPRNTQTSDERAKLVFRIKAWLVDGLDRLRPGMSADVWLEPLE